MTNTIVVDLDGTLTIDDKYADYADAIPNAAMVEAVRDWKALGFAIAIHTSRNMRTYAGSIGRITANTVPTIVAWLRKHDIPFDELHVGKPWCGHEGFYVDDRAIRPSEFTSMSPEQIKDLLAREKAALTGR